MLSITPDRSSQVMRWSYIVVIILINDVIGYEFRGDLFTKIPPLFWSRSLGELLIAHVEREHRFGAISPLEGRVVVKVRVPAGRLKLNPCPLADLNDVISGAAVTSGAQSAIRI